MVTIKTSRKVKTAGAPRTTASGKVAAAAGAAVKTGAGTTVSGPIPRLPKGVAGAVRAVRDKQAVDIVVLDLRKAGGFTDYFVICTGTNARQIHAIADGVADTLRKSFGERPVLAEGLHKSEWILLDYFNFVVHVFSRDCRAFYDLERLWGDAKRYACADTD